MSFEILIGPTNHPICTVAELQHFKQFDQPPRLALACTQLALGFDRPALGDRGASGTIGNLDLCARGRLIGG